MPLASIIHKGCDTPLAKGKSHGEIEAIKDLRWPNKSRHLYKKQRLSQLPTAIKGDTDQSRRQSWFRAGYGEKTRILFSFHTLLLFHKLYFLISTSLHFKSSAKFICKSLQIMLCIYKLFSLFNKISCVFRSCLFWYQSQSLFKLMSLHLI